MIALLLAQAAAVMAPPSILPGAIGRQVLPAAGCAAYLWDRGPAPALVAMAGAQPARLRLSLGGSPADYARTAETGGDTGFGFARSTEYRLGEVVATLDLVLAPRPDLGGGGSVTDGLLTVTRPGADTVVLPVGGLVGCAPTR